MQALQQRFGRRYRWLLLLSVMIGTMASVMSSTIINVAIPDMSRFFSLGQERAQWATSGFMAAMTVSMLATPWLLERFGYRRIYTSCVLLLMAGGIGGGLADNYTLVLAARIAEGLAAGVLQPIPPIIILRAFESNQQGRASGIFGMGVVLAPALGPSVGGLLVELFGWRSIFFMVVPFCVAALWLANRYVPVTAPDDSPAGANTRSLDWRGMITAGIGTLCLLNGLVQLQGGTLPVALGLILAALMFLGVFVRWQRHLGQRQARGEDTGPLLNLALFADKRFASGSIVAFIYGTALFGSTYLVPVFLQMGLHLSAAYVGTVLLPAGLLLAGTIAVVGRMADKQPAHRLVSIGLLLLALSFWWMTYVGHQPASRTVPALLFCAVVGRIGLGFILPSLNLGSMRGLSPAFIPQGSSAINFLRTLGGAAGVSLCGIVLEWRVAAHGATLEAGSGIADDGRIDAFNETFLMLAALCAVALMAARRMKANAGHESPSAS
ncbi:MFS transporter [Hydrogenophaga sp. 5NK40-0174]|uniref:MFS transporter n=1 Tax=Hydrogenophaga sp. 5NK40-0174 TaxID=3127649 RepID=UPI00333E1D18